MYEKLLEQLPMGTNKKTSSGKNQLKLTLPDDVMDRLETVAARTGKENKQEVIKELIAIYLPVYTSVCESMTRAVGYHIKNLTEEITQNKSREMQENSANLETGQKIPKGKIFKESGEGEYTRLASHQEGEKKEEGD